MSDDSDLYTLSYRMRTWLYFLFIFPFQMLFCKKTRAFYREADIKDLANDYEYHASLTNFEDYILVDLPILTPAEIEELDSWSVFPFAQKYVKQQCLKKARMAYEQKLSKKQRDCVVRNPNSFIKKIDLLETPFEENVKDTLNKLLNHKYDLISRDDMIAYSHALSRLAE